MKKGISVLLCLCFLLTVIGMPAFATEQPKKLVSVEYLEDGSYFVIEITQDMPRGRDYSTSGTKTGTYYNSSGALIWKLTVRGSFSYNPGVSAKATSASATVAIADSSAKFVSKNAWTSGASAYGYAQVKYGSVTQSKTVVLTCDKYGNLS